MTLIEILIHLIECNPGISDSAAKKLRLIGTFFTQRFLPGHKRNKCGP